MKRLICLVFAVLTVVSFSSCTDSEPLTRTVAALDTVCSVALYDTKEDALLDAACKTIQEYEQLWSRTVPDSDIARLNAAKGKETAVSADTTELFQIAQFYSLATEGAFDITTAALTDLWKAADENDVLPAPTELTAACQTTGAYKLQFGIDTVTAEKGTTVDVGGIAKGAVADKVAEILSEQGCTSAVIDLGGNIVALGTKPDGKPFHIGIADPNNPEALIATVAVSDRAVVTSGSYQRGYEIGGKRYSHILDPETGQPVENDLASVTILAPHAVDADVLSTACFVMGYEKANAFLAAYEDMEAVFVMTDGTVVATDGVELV